MLDAHEADETATFFVPPEDDAFFNLTPELDLRHVRLFPAIGGNGALVSLGGIIDELVDGREVGVSALADHGVLPRTDSRWPCVLMRAALH
jgi:hypothetical protein